VLNYDTGLDILRNVLSRADELEIGVAEREEEAKAYIQAAYISVLSEGYPWPFARKDPPGVITTNRERTNTATFTNGLNTFTFGTAPDASLATRKIFAETDEVVYRIQSHLISTTAGVLDSVYLGVSGTYNVHIFQDEYSLATDFLRPITHKFLRPADSREMVELIGIDEMEGMFGRRLQWSGTDNPRYCAFIGNSKIKIWPWTTSSKRFEYKYIFHPGVLDFTGVAATDTPIIQPAEDRVVLSLMAVGNLLVDKNDDRASLFLDAAVAKISAMKRLQQTKSRARFWVASNNNVSTVR